MAAGTDGLRIETITQGVTGIWLDRPARRNALDAPLTAALLDAFENLADDVVVLGTSDARCFCAGADLDMDDATRRQVSDDLYRLYERILSLPSPIVAVVQGLAVGGGAQLALASDMRVGDSSTAFRFAGPGHGLAVGAWGLPSQVGHGRAIDLCLTMRTVGAEESLSIGLLDRVADDARVTALELAEQLAALDRAAVARVKRVARDASGLLAALGAERVGNRETWSGSIAGLRRRETGSSR